MMLKSSPPGNHWTSERWNTESIHSDVQDLELAQGIKDSLEEAGFETVDTRIPFGIFPVNLE